MNLMTSYDDDEIVEMIRSGGREMSKAIDFLYSEKGVRIEILRFLISKRTSRVDAEDFFQEAMKIFVLKTRNGAYKRESSIKNFLFGIVKNLSHTSQVTKERRRLLMEKKIENGDQAISPEKMMIKEEQKVILRELLKSLGEKCQKVLELWRLNYSMQEIAKELDYKSEMMARKKKHTCMKKLVEIVHSRNDLLESLK